MSSLPNLTWPELAVENEPFHEEDKHDTIIVQEAEAPRFIVKFEGHDRLLFGLVWLYSAFRLLWELASLCFILLIFSLS